MTTSNANPLIHAKSDTFATATYCGSKSKARDARAIVFSDDAELFLTFARAEQSGAQVTNAACPICVAYVRMWTGAQRIVAAMLHTPYAAGIPTPELRANIDLDGIAKWIESLAAYLRSHAESDRASESELTELREQRRAVRAFLGVDA